MYKNIQIIIHNSKTLESGVIYMLKYYTAMKTINDSYMHQVDKSQKYTMNYP